MPQRLLWRLTGATQETLTQPERLVHGLTLHLRYADVLAVLVQIGHLQQAYLALHGCVSCAQGRCAPGCTADLLRRLLAACFPGATMHLATSGMARRPYVRLSVAVPTPAAQPLDGTLLHGWNEARIHLLWRAGKRGVQCAALLTVGADGPSPAAVLQSHGWQPRPLDTWLARRTLPAPIPHLRTLPRQTHLAPALLLPIPSTTLPGMEATVSGFAINRHPAGNGHTVGHDSPDDAAVVPTVSNALSLALDDAALAAWLQSALRAAPLPTPMQDTPAALEAVVPEEPMSTIHGTATAGSWPAGPCDLAPQAVAHLLHQVTTHPAFTRGSQASQIGVVKGRLTKVLGLSEAAAAAMMVWLDAAQVLVAPLRPDDSWRRPRPLATTDLEQIAAYLMATPVPSAMAIQAAYGDDR
jgi:hypothetical protein